MTAVRMTFEDLVDGIRAEEEKHHVAPLRMSKKYENKYGDNESWHFGFDKVVLYHCAEDQTKNHNYIWQAKETLDCDLHARAIRRELELKFREVEFRVKVRPQFKKLPIPFISIPIQIPFTDIGWKKSPNKMRGRGNEYYATLPVHVEIKAVNPLGNESPLSVWNSLNEIACLHTNNYVGGNNSRIPGTSKLAERGTYNPFLWLGFSVAWVLSFIVPTSVSRMVPNFIKQLGRPYAYGYPVAKHVIDEPMIEAGALALAANVSTYTVALICFLGKDHTLILQDKMGEREVAVSDLGAKNSTGINGPGLFNKNTAKDADVDIRRTPHAPFATRAIIKPKQ